MEWNKIIKFNSSFLNEQIKLRNLIYIEQTYGMETTPSFDFIGEESSKQNQTTQTKQEGFRYSYTLNGYRFPF